MAKILVIDDDGIARDAISVFLSRQGHTVLAAVDGIAGVEMFKSSGADLIILDRDLPGLSGSGVFARIREISPDTPVLVLSGYDAPEDVEKYLRNGASAFLSKADGLSNVLPRVEKLLGGGGAPHVPASERPRLLVAEDDEQVRAALARPNCRGLRGDTGAGRA